jgi:predicted homoserine dehydrogenase-like protein
MVGDVKIKVGLVGTGLIIRGLVKLLSNNKEMTISGVLTRRQGIIDGLEIAKELVFQSPEKFFSKSDVIVVSTGDPIYSTAVIFEAFKYNLPVVTMDADTMVTSGTWLSKQGLITESNGDQPGCLAVLRQEIIEMGFEPLVYGNIKGFRNLNPTADDMSYWALKQGYSLRSVTSFTDGTKIQIEQALVANAFGATISKQGMEGIETEDFVNSGYTLAALASQSGSAMSDYILSKSAPPGVFIVSTHKESVRNELQTYKMGDGPYYHHYKPAHLCFFEIPGTIKKLLQSKEVLINNGRHPTISVAAIAKRKLDKGDFILNGIGSFDIRGEAVRICEVPNHVPVGLMQNVVLKENVEAGQIITFSDIDIPPSMALSAWSDTLKGQEANIEFENLVEKLNNQP